MVDFKSLNDGPRLRIAATDIETGDVVVFDNEHHAIEMKHLQASCGYLPEFPAVVIDGRLLGDGGLAANAPVELIIDDMQTDVDHIVFVVDLFARDGDRPEGLEAALVRKNDLIFANQTWFRLNLVARQSALLNRLAALEGRKDGLPKLRIFYLSYRAPPEEAGPEKAMDLSQTTLESRWREGFLDMQEALRMHDEDGTPVLSSVRRSSIRKPAA
jgi:NTE family protein